MNQKIETDAFKKAIETGVAECGCQITEAKNSPETGYTFECIVDNRKIDAPAETPKKYIYLGDCNYHNEPPKDETSFSIVPGTPVVIEHSIPGYCPAQEKEYS